VFCSRCGTSLADGSQFCVECGHTVESSSTPAAPLSGEKVCAKCSKSIFPGARFCWHCGLTVPIQTVIVGNGGSAVAATAAYEPIDWQQRRPRAKGRLLLWLALIIVAGALVAVGTTNNSVFPQIKQYVTTSHAEMITEGSVAIKPHGFASYKITVPEGAIDVSVSGRFDASGRKENDMQAYVLTEAEFVFWQGGYASSPFYDSGVVPRGDIQAALPGRSGTYYIIFSNKPSRVEKTVHVNAVLRYDTWLPDEALYIRDKLRGWFE
jgi:hypothetical protein